jgi:hypothetical protein
MSLNLKRYFANKLEGEFRKSIEKPENQCNLAYTVYICIFNSRAWGFTEKSQIFRIPEK